MTEPRERLFKAWADAMGRTTPELDPRIRERVLAAHTKRARPSAFPLGYRWALAGFAVAVAIVAVLVMVRVPAAPSFQVAGRSDTGKVGAWLTAEPGHPLPLLFSEGTRVVLSQRSRARVSGVTRGGARIELASGGVDAAVAHLPGANWTFGAGPFEITVTGTQLGVSWAPDAGKFELSVSQGSVLVRGPFIEGEQEVRAGQICRVDMTRRLMELSQLGAERASSERTPPETTPTPRTAEPQPAAADSGAPLASSSGAPRAVSADAWLEAARAARLAGHPDEERAALLACRRRAPGQAAAAQAAYLLGRASSAAEAARWFETYLREQPQGLLAREAAGRLIESYRASGNTNAAQTAASRYLARYPHGPHAPLARQALTSRSEGRE